MWSQRAQNRPPRGEYALIKGIAYPRIKKGHNETRSVKAPIPNRAVPPTLENRAHFYTDPAVVLSEGDLNAIDGAEGAPLCLEHNTQNVVGRISHTWMDDANGGGRCLKLIGRIPLNDKGREIVSKIQRGELNGLSVNYGLDIDDNGELESKAFREVSLCKSPFFEGCNLSVAVVASAADNQQTKTGSYISEGANASGKSPTEIFVPIMAEQPADNTPVPPTGNLAPRPDQNDSADLMRQLDAVKGEQTETVRKMQEKMAQMEAENARFRQREAADAAKYAEAQRPKLQEFLAAQEKRRGGVLDDGYKAAMESAFLDRNFQTAADGFWREHEQAKLLEVTAAKREEEVAKQAAEIAALKKERETLIEHQRRIGAGISAMRPQYAVGEAVAASKKQEEPEIPNIKTPGVEASGISLNDMMVAVPRPSKEAEPFLAAYGFMTGLASVTASGMDPYNNYPTPTRSLPTAIPRVPEFRFHDSVPEQHGQIRESNGMKKFAPEHWHMLLGNEQFRSGDLSRFATVYEPKTGIIEEKRCDDYNTRLLGAGRK